MKILEYPNSGFVTAKRALLFALILSVSSAPAFACSNNKLDLDWCGAAAKPAPQPLNKPDFGGSSSGLTLPDPHPTIVTPTDSRGKTNYGPGIQKKF